MHKNMDCSEEKVLLAGKNIHYDAAVNLMDNEIREDVHNRLAPCTTQEFMDAYCIEYFRKYNTEFEVN